MDKLRRNSQGVFASRARALLIGAGAVAWSAALAWQMHSAMAYNATPGLRAEKAPALAASDKQRVLMVIHPECPCTRASLNQLREIQAVQGAKLEITVLVAFDGEPHPSDNEKMARAIPNTEVRLVSADSADALGAKTSGETFWFDASGQLLYHGGLTEGRGMEVPSAGALCLQGKCESKTTTGEVYGCPLRHS